MSVNFRSNGYLIGVNIALTYDIPCFVHWVDFSINIIYLFAQKAKSNDCDRFRNEIPGNYE